MCIRFQSFRKAKEGWRASPSLQALAHVMNEDPLLCGTRVQLSVPNDCTAYNRYIDVLSCNSIQPSTNVTGLELGI